MEINKNILGNRIRECRKEVNMTQNELADILKVQRQIVSYYETGDRTPDIYTLSTLAETFKTSTDYLLGLTDVQSTDTKIKDVCEYIGLSEEAIKILHCDSKILDEVSTQYLKLYSYFIVSETMGKNSLFSTIMLYKESLGKQTETLKDYATNIEDYIKDVDVSELSNVIWERRRDVEKDTKFCKYEAVEEFKKVIDEYLYDELKAYTEALEEYENKSNNIYKQRMDLLMKGLDSNADNNQTE